MWCDESGQEEEKMKVLTQQDIKTGNHISSEMENQFFGTPLGDKQWCETDLLREILQDHTESCGIELCDTCAFIGVRFGVLLTGRSEERDTE